MGWKLDDIRLFLVGIMVCGEKGKSLILGESSEELRIVCHDAYNLHSSGSTKNR